MASILVVDDEMGIRELLNEILTDEGHTVYSAESAIQARTIREQMRPDLVLLDIWMPDTDGITLLKEWSKTGQLTMPVVMMSGHATIDTAVEATRIGALNFLEKPIALQKLLKTVNKALESSPKYIAPEEGKLVQAVPVVAANGNSSLELFAEELRLAQDNLGLITGKLLPDDLLGKIFSQFCIGK